MQSHSLLQPESSPLRFSTTKRIGRWLALSSALLLGACSGGSDDKITENTNATPGPDGVPPAAVSVTIVNNADLSESVALDEVVLLRFETSETVMTPVVLIGGQPATVEGGNLTWTATRAMTETDTEGEVSFSIQLEDRSGEVADPITESTDGSTLTYCIEGCAEICELPEQTVWDFEDAGQTYTLIDFGPDLDGGRTAAASMLVDDPVLGGSMVVASQKDAAAEVWGGSLVIEGTETAADKSISLTDGDPFVSVRFWSPAPGKTVKLKFEDLNDASIFVEADALTTASGEWEVLTFDMSQPAAGAIDPFVDYEKVVLFYDFGTAGTGSAQSFYWDDVTHGGVGGVDCGSEEVTQLTFEDPTAAFVFADFGPDGDSGRTAAATAVVVDPTDPSNRVLASQKDAAAEVWGGSWVVAGLEAAPEFVLNLTAGDPIVSVKFWSPEAGRTVKLKLEQADNSDVFVEADAVTTVSQNWETLYFDMANPAAGAIDPFASYGKFVIFWNFGTAGVGEAVSFYWDDISHGGLTIGGGGGGEEPVAEAPATLAAAPDAPQGDVLSLFSDTYTRAAAFDGVDFNPNWGQATVSTIETIAGEEVLKYADLNYQGTTWTTPADVSSYDVFRMNVWTADSTELRVFLINSGAVTGGDPVEVPYSLDTSVKGEWVSVEIPMSAFAGVDLTQVDQIKVDGNGTVFFDNWYFGPAGASAPDMPVAVAAAPDAPQGDVLSLFSDTYTRAAAFDGVDFNPNWGQATVSTIETIAGEEVLKYADLNYQGTTWTTPADVSSYDVFRMNVWTADSTELRVFLINSGAVTGGDPVEVPYSLDTSVKGEWVSVEIPMSAFAGVDLTQVDQIKVDGNGTVFFDNWYFGPAGASAPDMPTTLAAAPTDAEGQVLSVFSDAYTDLVGTEFNPDWGQATVTTVEAIDGQQVLKYAELDYQGTALAAANDVSGYDALHLDYWTADATELNFFLINSSAVTGGDAVQTPRALDVSVTGQWVSVNIPLTEFAPVDLTIVDQLMATGNGTVFLDNIYFRNDAIESVSIQRSSDPGAVPGEDFEIFVSTSLGAADLALMVDDVQIAGVRTGAENDWIFPLSIMSGEPPEFSIIRAGQIGDVVASTTTDGTSFAEPGGACQAATVFDFEDNTQTFTFADFGPDAEGGRTAAPSMLVVDPVLGGNTVVASQKDAVAEVWGGSWVVEGTETVADKVLTFIPGDNLVTVRFWSPAVGKTVRLKLENLADANVFVEADAVTTADQAWEILTFDMSAADPAATYAKVVIFYDFDTAGTGETQSFYWDDVTYGGNCGSTATEPTTLAAAPTDAEGQVLSLFSDTYTRAAAFDGVDFNPNWGQATVSTIETIAGEEVLKYADLNYQGTTWTTPADVSSYDVFRMNVWTADSTELRVFLINSGAVTGGDPVEVPYSLDTSVKGEWVSVEIPMSAFAGVDLTQVDQIKVDGNGTVFFDNWYFGPAGASAPDMPVAVAAAPDAPQGDVLSLFSDTYTRAAAFDGVDFNPNWGQATVSTIETIAGEEVLKYADLNYQGTTWTTPADVSSYDVFRMNVWTADSTELRVFLINSGAVTGGDPVEVPYSLDTSVKGEWVSVEIPMSAFAGVDLTQVDQIKVDGNGTVFFDNWYFGPAGASAPDMPVAVAAAPDAPQGDVLSLFSDTYTRAAAFDGVDFNPNWGQATVSTIETIAGEEVLKYADLNYQGTTWTTPADVSSYDVFRMNVWTADSTELRVFLINSGAVTGGDPVEVPYSLDTSVKGEWVSVEIPMSAFAGVDLTQVDQIKVDGNGTVFFDNWYFAVAP